MIVRPSSMQRLRRGRALPPRCRDSARRTGYSTRQSVASVTCETRARPSNAMLSLRVIAREHAARALAQVLRLARTLLEACRRRRCAAASSVATFASRSGSRLPRARRFSISRRRWRIASTSRRGASGCRAGRPAGTDCGRRPRCRPAPRRASAPSGRCAARRAARQRAATSSAPEQADHDLAIGERRVVVRDLAQARGVLRLPGRRRRR